MRRQRTPSSNAIAILLAIFFLLWSPCPGTTAKVVLNRNSHRSEPAGFGQALSTTTTVQAHLQIVHTDSQLCDKELFIATQPVVPPTDGVPVALLVEDGGCHDGEKAAIASLSPYVKYIIGFDPDPLGNWVDTMVSGDETDLSLVFVSGKSGADFLDAIDEQSKEMLSTGGLVIELDGSVPEDYIRGRKLIAYLPKPFAFLSMCGSLYIVYSIIGNKRNRERKLQQGFQRLLLMLSVGDVFSSFGLVLTTWAIPKETDGGFLQYAWDLEFPGAAGNEATCSFQGFLIQFGYLSSILITAFLSIQFVLVVRYNWREERMKKAEIGFFVIGVLFPFCTGVGLAAAGAMHPMSGNVCWLNTNPYTCWGDSDPLCTSQKANSDWIWSLSLSMALVWIMLALVVVIVCMVLLFLTVRFQEKRMRRWSQHAAEGRRQKQVLNKALLYIGAFLFVWTPTILRQFNVIKYGIVQDAIVSTFLPMQGFLNAIIYSGGYTKVTDVFRPSLKSAAAFFSSHFFRRTRRSSSKDAATTKDGEISSTGLPCTSSEGGISIARMLIAQSQSVESDDQLVGALNLASDLDEESDEDHPPHEQGEDLSSEITPSAAGDPSSNVCTSSTGTEGDRET